MAAHADNGSDMDVVMIGAGPAALSAAIYTARENLSTILIEKGVIGGLAASTDKIENYPGFAEGVSGLDLSDQLRRQAERFGAKIELGEVEAVQRDDSGLLVRTDSRTLRCRAVLIATGTDHKKLGVNGEDEFAGRGVHYCATCDGALYQGKRLVVIGGGNSAVQESLFLRRFASRIDVLVRSDRLKASAILQQQVITDPKIKLHFNTTIREITGHDGFVREVRAEDSQSHQPASFRADGVFIFIGLVPNTRFIKSSDIRLDEHDAIITDERLMTSVEGVFAAGDVRSGATMQIASAVGEGATAALRIRQYIEKNGS